MAKLVILLLAVLPLPSLCALVWQTLENPEAVCNDFSRAGYFLEKSDEDSSRWIVFLESGGLCHSPETCNERFFNSTRRRSENGNLTKLWNEAQNGKLTDYINPYVTSIETFSASSFNGSLEVNGTDILDRNCSMNPFCEYNMVLVPYCSSDVWLGNDSRSLGIDVNSQSPDSPQRQFLNSYNPVADSLQFTFRGGVIFRSVIEELVDKHDLLNSSDVILGGSSAGGVGAVNHAKWLRDLLLPSTELSIIADSSWFVNFKDVIYVAFNRSLNSGRTLKSNTLLDLISDIPQCSDTTRGSPCCLSLSCMLQEEKYFPVEEVPTIVLTSLYDVFLLAYTINETLPIGERQGERNNSSPSLGLQFLITVSEYGGVMNNTLRSTASLAPNNSVSYIATHCYQHIYLATSTLWNGLLRNESTAELSESLGTLEANFRHTISSGAWTSYNFTRHNDQSLQPFDMDRLSSCNPLDAHNIRDALGMWMICHNKGSRLVFTEPCYTPHCNPTCPDEFLLNTEEYRRYPDWARIVVIVWVVGVTVLSILTKVVLYIWEKLLFLKQRSYIHSIDKIIFPGNDIDGGVPEFPILSSEEAISVAALDLHYKVGQLPGKKVKDERHDATSVSLAINDKNIPSVGDEEEERDIIDDDDEENDDHQRLYRTYSERQKQPKKRNRRPSDATATTSPAFANSVSWSEENRRISRTSDQTTTTRLSSVADPHNIDPNFYHMDTTSQPSDPHVNSNASSPADDDKRDRLTQSTTSRGFSIASSKSTLPLLPLKSYPSPPQDSGGPKYDEAMTPLTPHEEIHGNLGDVTKCTCCPQLHNDREILKGISLYFNPGELVGIMGPSGSGKTTFLDILTGRRKHNDKGEIYVNGHPMNKVREWYIANTGYVLQLATPYYEEMTVRENLVLAANMKLGGMTWRERFQRVEQVIEMAGLKDKEDSIVGGSTGPGLSGGQKKRLTIALQLLKMPRVLFLDEPTSGLDATASQELLVHLNDLAGSNRTVVLTIHQPRFEIFYMFHKLVLISDGRVAYHGIPQNAYAVFVEALHSQLITKKLVIPQLEEKNPADVIMDMLGKPKMRKVILRYYTKSKEPALVERAIQEARFEAKESCKAGAGSTLQSAISTFENEAKKSHHSTMFDRLAVLEARASKRTSFVWFLYLPIIFFSYGLLLGTVYFQTDEPLLIISGFCVYSVASALFMFPALHNYYLKALEVYRYENEDGAGKAIDLVLQGFIRFVTKAIIPVIICALVLYLLLVKITAWDINVFLQLVVVNMALNQTWIALLIFIISAAPMFAFRLSPIISSVAGFTSGFFISRDKIHWWYRWLFYINPNYYGFSSSANLLLANFTRECNETEFECYAGSSEYILREFDFDDINPYMHIAILLLMTHVFLVLAVLANWLHHTSILIRFRNWIRHSNDQINSPMEMETCPSEEVLSEELRGFEPESDVFSSSPEDGVFMGVETNPSTPMTAAASPSEDKNWVLAAEAGSRWKRYAKERSIEQESDITENTAGSVPSGVEHHERPNRLFERSRQNYRKSHFIGQQHEVFTGFAGVVDAAMQHRKLHTPTPLPTPSGVGLSLRERQLAFEDHVKVTQDILKEQTEELINSQDCDDPIPKKTGVMLWEVAKRLQTRPRFANVVHEVMNSYSSNNSGKTETDGDQSSSHAETPSSHHPPKLVKRISHRTISSEDLSSAVPLDELRRTKRRSNLDTDRRKHQPSQRKMSIPDVVTEEDHDHESDHYYRPPSANQKKPLLRTSISLDSGQSVMSRASSRASTIHESDINLEESQRLRRTPTPKLPNTPENFELDEL